MALYSSQKYNYQVRHLGERSLLHQSFGIPLQMLDYKPLLLDQLLLKYLHIEPMYHMHAYEQHM